MLSIQKTEDGVIFKTKVQPGAAKNEIVGVQEDALTIKINTPPVKGKAKTCRRLALHTIGVCDRRKTLP